MEQYKSILSNKKYFLTIAFGLLLTFNSYAQESMFIETETRYWDSDNTDEGYTLFGVAGKTYLINFEGKIVHSWNIGTNPRLLDNGNILDATKDDPSGFSGWQELDWNGNVVWEYAENRANYAPHHDWVRIYNKALGAYTTLYIANKTVSSADALAVGCDPSNKYSDAQMDAIVEVDMDGNVVWEWWFFNHVVQNIDASKSSYGIIADNPGKIDLNLPGRPVKRDWLHCNSIDYNPELGQIVTNSVQGEFYVIDHDNTFIAKDPEGSIALAASDKGNFLYRFGDPARYEQGDPPSILEDWTKSTTGDKQIGGAHDIHWIKPGLPGEGNFLIFNNAEYLFELTPQSYIFEINPFKNASGVNSSNYVNPPDAGYYVLESPDKDAMKQKKNISNQIEWMYYSKTCQTFFSTIGSGAQRLPNGNTLICSMNEGHIFEVTNEGNSVWEYIVPVTRDGIKKIITDSYPTYNAVFRAYRYSPDHPAFDGKDLTPNATITGFDPDYLKPSILSTTTGAVIQTIQESSNNLKSSYPNPFSDNTRIPYVIDEKAKVNLSVYNNNGQLINVLENQTQLKGEYEKIWDGTNNQGTNVSAGIYHYVLLVGDKIQSKKLIYLR